MSANILCKSCNRLLPENGWMLTGYEFVERLPDGRALWRIHVVTPKPGMIIPQLARRPYHRWRDDLRELSWRKEKGKEPHLSGNFDGVPDDWRAAAAIAELWYPNPDMNRVVLEVVWDD